MTASSRDSAEALCRQIEAFFGGGRCFLLSKGRVGLYVGLRALGLPPGSKVLMPGYTCVVVPAAVQHAGLRPVYVDIDPDTYNLDAKRLDDAAGGGLSAVIVQHTYGIPADMEAIGAWASSRSLPVIEDCCHTFGARTGGRLCGTLGSFAFMSGQWNKFFSTGLGGMLLVGETTLAERVAEILRNELLAPGTLQDLRLRAQIMTYRLLVRPGTAALLTGLYRRLNRWGLTIGSSSQEELTGAMPKKYLTAMAPSQVRQGLRGLAEIEENIRHRTQLTAWYHGQLPRLGLAVSPAIEPAGMPLLRYPLRVANKQELLGRAGRAGVEIGSWFECPLHPAETRLEDFGYLPGACPRAEAASATVINLPTHPKVGPRAAQRTLDFLHKYARQ